MDKSTNITNTPFLKQVAKHYSANYSNLEDFCFIFPNRRSGQFFIKYFEKSSKSNCLRPYVTTISDFLDDNTESTLATPTELIFNLYQAFCEVTNNPDYEFDKFINWGNILVADFNDVDLYMVDAKQLFTNIHDWKEISTDYISDDLKKELSRYLNINFNKSDDDSFWKNTDQVDKKFTSLWKLLYPLYRSYNAHLEKKGLTYQGKMLREFAKRLKVANNDDFHYAKYIFVGFNLLSESEKMIFDAFKKRGIAEFHWDYASYALKNEANKGHKHIHALSKRYPSSINIEDIEEFTTDMNVVGISSKIGQTKYAFAIVENLIQRGLLKDPNNGIDTAIVLPDESLFAYLTNSVPENIHNINATLGLSLRYSDISSLIRIVSKVHKNAYRPLGTDDFLYYKEFVRQVLSHPIIKCIYPNEVTEITNHISSTNDFYVSEKYLKCTSLANIFTTIVDTQNKDEVIGFIDRLITLCNTINSFYSDNQNEESQLSLQSTFALQYIDILNETKDLIREYGIPMCESSVFYLFDKLTSLYTIPFEGEPLSGLQIMGMLETRNLDFDNLIILSMNERVFPRKFFKSSFIPPNMRRYFHMATIDEQESISAYYFYRLITRAKHIFFVYDTSTMGIGSSEYSRFVSQLEKVYGCKLNTQTISLQVKPESSLPISVPKNDEIYRKIQRYCATDDSKKYLSASSIKTLIKCPLKFYFHYIGGMSDENEESQFMDYATFGTIVHDTLQQFYYPESDNNDGERKPRIVTKKEILYFKDHKLDKALIRNVNRIYLNKDSQHELEPLIGETAITFNALKYYAEQVLSFDANLLASDSDFIKIYECEVERKVNLKIGNNTFNFTYKIDRLDRINDSGPMRIIDYKTGKDNVNCYKIENVVSNKDHGHNLAIMQLLLYCNAYKAEGEDVSMGVKPIIYKIKDIDSSGISINRKTIENIFEDNDLNTEFLQRIGAVLNNFFDKDTPFTQCEDKDDSECKYCKFIEFCRR